MIKKIVISKAESLKWKVRMSVGKQDVTQTFLKSKTMRQQWLTALISRLSIKRHGFTDEIAFTVCPTLRLQCENCHERYVSELIMAVFQQTLFIK